MRQAVALGAAVQAGILEGSLPGHMVMDIWQVQGARYVAMFLITATGLWHFPASANMLQLVMHCGLVHGHEGWFCWTTGLLFI